MCLAYFIYCHCFCSPGSPLSLDSYAQVFRLFASTHADTANGLKQRVLFGPGDNQLQDYSLCYVLCIMCSVLTYICVCVCVFVSVCLCMCMSVCVRGSLCLNARFGVRCVSASTCQCVRCICAFVLYVCDGVCVYV